VVVAGEVSGLKKIPKESLLMPVAGQPEGLRGSAAGMRALARGVAAAPGGRDFFEGDPIVSPPTLHLFPGSLHIPPPPPLTVPDVAT